MIAYPLVICYEHCFIVLAKNKYRRWQEQRNFPTKFQKSNKYLTRLVICIVSFASIILGRDG